MLYWAKEIAVNKPLLVLSMEEGEVFYRPLIRSQSFSELVPLDFELLSSLTL